MRGLARLLSILFVAAASSAGALQVDPAVMAKAFPAGGLGQAGADAHVALARDLAAKSLGDDSRDLVFIPITPCTVFDTRFATDVNSMGIVANGVTKKFYSHLTGGGGNYTNWGGNPSCPETELANLVTRPFAVMMTSYVSDATANGWVTFYRDGDADPSLATISVYYSPGPTRTQTVIAKSGRGYGSLGYDVAVTGRFASAHVSASVVGYFFKPTNIVLPASSSATSGSIMKGTSRFIHNIGSSNTFVGVDAGSPSGAGLGFNAGLGDMVLGAASGLQNTGVGSRALESQTTADQNTAIGAFALTEVTTGGGNVAVGAAALSNLTTGANNIVIGTNAGQLVNGSGNIVIGTLGLGGESNTIRFGNSGSHTRAFVAGIRGVTTANANAIPVLIDSAGQLGTVSSSREVKDHIADMDRASSDLMKLRPVTFNYKAHGEGAPLQYGLVAEEVEQVYPELVAKTSGGKAETVMYQFLPPMLLNEYQKQQRRIVELEGELASLRAAVEKLQASR